MKNIFEHIVEEHHETADILEKLSGGFDDRTFEKLKISLRAHMDAEEASLYEGMRDEEKEMVEHAVEEHDEIREIMNSMSGKDEEKFQSKLSDLKETITDHVEEEESEVLPKAKEMFDKVEVKKLSEKFDKIEERVKQKAG